MAYPQSNRNPHWQQPFQNPRSLRRFHRIARSSFSVAILTSALYTPEPSRQRAAPPARIAAARHPCNPVTLFNQSPASSNHPYGEPFGNLTYSNIKYDTIVEYQADYYFYPI
jgi:hypothetical protein